ncbi:MAG: hypothetical protein IT240_02245 [Bacteroidia bacterium]|nr:hypothetical protein [Bacteroidia bacterium]
MSYGNPCEALREGVSSWTLGVCRDTTFTCIDSTKICSDCPCYALYKPVCGCDGITYENDCFAKNAGLLKWSDGACEGVRNCDPHFYYWYDSFNENFHFSSTSFQTDSLIYSWTFGDGISSTGPYSSHDFADTTIGAWKVCLEVSHLDGTCSEQFCDSVYTSIMHDPCHAGFGFTVQGTQDAITFLSGQASNPQNQRSWIVGDTIYENTDTLLVNIATLADEVICQVLHNDSTGCNDTVCISGKEVRFSLMALPTGKVLQSEKRISTVFPNPIHAGSTISIHGLETNKHYTFTFFDSKGAEVSKPGSVSGSDLGAQIIAPGAGMYFLEIKDTSVLYRSVTPVIVLP